MKNSDYAMEKSERKRESKLKAIFITLLRFECAIMKVARLPHKSYKS